MIDNPDWNHLVSAYNTYMQAQRNFFHNTSPEERVSILRQRLGWDRVAIDIASRLPIDEKKTLFDDFIGWSSDAYDAMAGFFFEIILSMPKDWVLENIEGYVEPLLVNASYYNYQSFLSLYSKIDRNLMIRLAKRALQHDDSEIRELGNDFLAK